MMDDAARLLAAFPAAFGVMWPRRMSGMRARVRPRNQMVDRYQRLNVALYWRLDSRHVTENCYTWAKGGQFSLVQYSAVHYSIAKYSAVKCSIEENTTVQYARLNAV